jgi:protein TonB
MLIQRFQNHPLANRYTASYVLAILLHLLFLLLLTPAHHLLVDSKIVPDRPNPLSFEFVESDARPSESPPDTRFRSDRNARSADQSTADLPRTEQAYNDGIVDIRGDFQTQRRSEAQEAQQQSERQPEGETGKNSEAEQIYRGLESMAWLKRKGLTTRAQREQSVFGAPANPRQSVAGTNKESRALDQGGFQLSTYDWAFAPYLQYLKRRVESNLFVPAAFSRLGMIDGESSLIFRIYPNGRMERLEVLDSRGSEMLLKASRQSIELSSPFKPLPVDFPEPYLEITYTFTFVLLDEHEMPKEIR